MPSPLSISEQMAHSTVRIECVLRDGSPSTGTGFFFRFADDGSQHIPAIVTNKHVVRGAVRGQFLMTLAHDDGTPNLKSHQAFVFSDFENLWIQHPSADVDLCVMPIAPLLHAANSQKRKLFYVALDNLLLPSKEELEDMDLLEDITMVGYPNGIWDEKHNMPVFRRGVTATHPNIDWNDRPEFLIDAACFPGSSGSPVFLYNQVGFATKTKGMVIGPGRVKLLGVLYAGPQHTATGAIRIVTVPTHNVPLAVTAIPNNLGLVIKSAKLLDMEPLLGQLAKKN